MAVRYVALNPVRARLVSTTADWRRSSTREYLKGTYDKIVRVAPVLERSDFRQFLAEPFDEDTAFAALRRSEKIGRPIGDPGWLRALEEQTERWLTPRRRRRKPRQIGD